MSFKMKNSVHNIIMSNGIVEKIKMPKGVHGATLNDGTIHINKDLSPVQQKIALSHEKVHRDQILRKDLSYDDECDRATGWFWKKHEKQKKQHIFMISGFFAIYKNNSRNFKIASFFCHLSKKFKNASFFCHLSRNFKKFQDSKFFCHL